MTIEDLRKWQEDCTINENSRNLQEVQYWKHQYKLLARAALDKLKEIEQVLKG
jgi:hypothetical protein